MKNDTEARRIRSLSAKQLFEGSTPSGVSRKENIMRYDSIKLKRSAQI